MWSERLARAGKMHIILVPPAAIFAAQTRAREDQRDRSERSVSNLVLCRAGKRTLKTNNMADSLYPRQWKRIAREAQSGVRERSLAAMPRTNEQRVANAAQYDRRSIDHIPLRGFSEAADRKSGSVRGASRLETPQQPTLPGSTANTATS